MASKPQLFNGERSKYASFKKYLNNELKLKGIFEVSTNVHPKPPAALEHRPWHNDESKGHNNDESK
jgi:hypothetical protein